MNTRDDILTKDNSGGSGDRRIVPTPSLDLAKYRAIAYDIEIPEKDFDEFLRTLWDIMSAFVHHGFDVKNIPAFLPELFEDSSDPGGAAIDSELEDDDDQT